MTRAAVRADLPRLRAIQTVALAEPWPDLLEPAVEGAGIVRVATGDADADRNTADDGRAAPVGYVVALPQGETAYLAELAVAPDSRRRGHGSRLLADLHGRLATAGFERVELTVRIGDDGARSFYGTAGYRTRGLLPDHYENGDGLRLVRPL